MNLPQTRHRRLTDATPGFYDEVIHFYHTVCCSGAPRWGSIAFFKNVKNTTFSRPKLSFIIKKNIFEQFWMVFGYSSGPRGVKKAFFEKSCFDPGGPLLYCLDCFCIWLYTKMDLPGTVDPTFAPLHIPKTLIHFPCTVWYSGAPRWGRGVIGFL